MNLGMPSDQLTAAERVLEMRDDFLLLVAAYNSIRDFDSALDAQALVITLNKFEDDHDITQIAWPPRLAPDDPSELEQPPEKP